MLTGGGVVHWVQLVSTPDGDHPEVVIMPPADTALRESHRRWFVVNLAGLEAERRMCLAVVS
jgi:hypothetical protein